MKASKAWPDSIWDHRSCVGPCALIIWGKVVGSQRDKYLWLRRTFGRAGTQTQGQEVQLKMEAKLPPGPSPTSFFPKIPTEDSALLILGAQKSFIRQRYNQGPVPSLFTAWLSNKSCVHPWRTFPPTFRQLDNYLWTDPGISPLTAAFNSSTLQKGFKHSSTYGGGGK